MATRISARDLSLNAPINSDDGASDILSNMSDGRESIEDTLEQIEFRRRGYELLKRNLAKMSERDREILVARKLRTPAATLESLSQKYGISRERVRQIEERAYDKLRDAVLKESEGKL
jgi:RNA polymerase sigma-32 factor